VGQQLQVAGQAADLQQAIGGKADRQAEKRTGGCVGAACPLRTVCCKGLVRAVVIVDAAGQSREEGTAE
jgi:hypothetical protein